MGRSPRKTSKVGKTPEARPGAPSRAIDLVSDSRGTWLALAAVLTVAGYAHYRLLDVPLDRDEGEFAYIAQQMLSGVPPYESGYAMKMPGIYAVYAVAMTCFGQSTRGIHLGLTVASLVTIVLVFVIARRLCGAWFAAAAAGFFAILSLDPEIPASAAQAEHFVLLAALAGIWTLQIVLRPSVGQSLDAPPHCARLGLALAGVCFGTAAVIKQHGAAFSLFAAWMVFDQWRATRPRRPGALCGQLACLAAGALLPVCVMLAAIYIAGVFEKFWFWTITYAREYATGASLRQGMINLKENVGRLIASQPLPWGLAVVGSLGLAWNQRARAARLFLPALLLCAFLGTCPGLIFRSHYLLYLLPAVAMFAAAGCQTIAELAGKLPRLSELARRPQTAAAIAAVVLVVCGFQSRYYLFQATPLEASRLVYGTSPFPEAVEIARYIAEHSRQSGPILVLGSEPEIYFYSGRRSASPHIYMYPLMERQPYALEMQKELAADVERSEPEWIVMELTGTAWLRQEASEQWLFGWRAELLANDYRLEGIVDVMDEQTVYRWRSAVETYTPRSRNWLGVYRRVPADGQAAATQKDG